jgi:hypothetical protein
MSNSATPRTPINKRLPRWSSTGTPELDCTTPRHGIHHRIHPKTMFIIAVQQPINRTTRTTRSDPLPGSPSRSLNTPRAQLKSP